MFSVYYVRAVGGQDPPLKSRKEVHEQNVRVMLMIIYNSIDDFRWLSYQTHMLKD